MLYDDYVKQGTMYYHTDCYQQKIDKERDEEKRKIEKRLNQRQTQKQKDDLSYIIDLWNKHISNTVVYSRLRKELNQLVARGIPSEQLVFTMEYIIKHRLNLNYPAGFKYFVDKKEIKDAYNYNKMRSKANKNIALTQQNQQNDTSPTFTFKKKQDGFQNILKKGES